MEFLVSGMAPDFKSMKDFIIEFLTHKTIIPRILLTVIFCERELSAFNVVLISLESQSTPLACLVNNLLEDL